MRLFRERLVKKLDIALQAARPPLHCLFDGTDFEATHVLRGGGRHNCEDRRRNE
jgi:hypothetical protein